jgi:hypothetical protein
MNIAEMIQTMIRAEVKAALVDALKMPTVSRTRGARTTAGARVGAGHRAHQTTGRARDALEVVRKNPDCKRVTITRALSITDGQWRAVARSATFKQSVVQTGYKNGASYRIA